jgi:hypothetical protein
VLERGVIETEFGSLEGSLAVPASPSGKGGACIRDLFNFYFKDVGADVVGEMYDSLTLGELYYGEILKS